MVAKDRCSRGDSFNVSTLSVSLALHQIGDEARLTANTTEAAPAS
jgi:hypothetical protein